LPPAENGGGGGREVEEEIALPNRKKATN